PPGGEMSVNARGPTHAPGDPDVQARPAGRDDIDQRIATAVFDVVDAYCDHVLRHGRIHDRHLLRPDRDRRALATKRQLADAGEPEVGRLERDAVAEFTSHGE